MPPSAISSKPFLLHARIGEGAALVSEELALQQLLRQRRAGDIHERPRRPIARVVNDLGQEVLAGPALAGEQHGRRRSDRDAGDHVPKAGDRRRGPDDALQAVRLGRVRPELPDLASQPGRLECAFYRRRDVIQIERLVGEVVRPELHRLDGGLDAGVGREQDHQDVLIELLHLAQYRHAVGVGQPVIKENEIDAFGELLERGFPGLGFEDVVAFRLEALAERPANEGFVVDDQDRGFGHSHPPAGAMPFWIAVISRLSSDREDCNGKYSPPCGIFRAWPGRAVAQSPAMAGITYAPRRRVPCSRVGWALSTYPDIAWFQEG